VTYLALLRGINVGGHNKVAMADLRSAFEDAGMKQVRTYINSGNVIFQSTYRNQARLATRLEQVIEATFGFPIRVVIRDGAALRAIVKAMPTDWKNDEATKCDVMFLWPEVDRPDVVDGLQVDADNEDVRYVAGAILWSVKRSFVTRSAMMKLVGTPLYKQMTIRNCNTTRKLLELMA
jgi:uncharacterized protein (DUF1697 family)